MRWFFLRHGATRANARRLLTGWSPLPLLPEGQWQAVRAGRLLRGVRLERAWSSDLLRARQSARGTLVAAGWSLPDPRLAFTPALRERRMGAWEGWPIERARRLHPGVLVSWWEGPPGGESLHELALRALRFLAACPEEPSLLVAHAGVLRALLGLLDGQPREVIGRLRLANGALLEREVPPGRWRELLEEELDLDQRRVSPPGTLRGSRPPGR